MLAFLASLALAQDTCTIDQQFIPHLKAVADLAQAKPSELVLFATIPDARYEVLFHPTRPATLILMRVSWELGPVNPSLPIEGTNAVPMIAVTGYPVRILDGAVLSRLDTAAGGTDGKYEIAVVGSEECTTGKAEIEKILATVTP